MVPPPMSVITYPYLIAKYVLNRCNKCLTKITHRQILKKKDTPPCDKVNGDVKGKQTNKRPRLSKSSSEVFGKNSRRSNLLSIEYKQ